MTSRPPGFAPGAARGAPLDVETLEALHRLLVRAPLAPLARHFGLSVGTLMSALDGLPVSRITTGKLTLERLLQLDTDGIAWHRLSSPRIDGRLAPGERAAVSRREVVRCACGELPFVGEAHACPDGTVVLVDLALRRVEA